MKKIYVLTEEGEPMHAYSSLKPIEEECEKWFDDHDTDFEVEKDFNWWVEGRKYKDGEEEKAWHDFIQDQFDSGTWSIYAWYEVMLD